LLGVFADTSYTIGSLQYDIQLYYTPHSMYSYVDNNGAEQQVVAWINAVYNSNDRNQQIRLWSSGNGQGDTVFSYCLPLNFYWQKDSRLPEVDKLTINWEKIYCFDYYSGKKNKYSKSIIKYICNGQWD